MEKYIEEKVGTTAIEQGAMETTDGEHKTKNIDNIRNENEVMTNSISRMQTEIEEKNSTIQEMGKMNRRLYAQNKHLTDIWARGDLSEKETESGSEKSDDNEREEMENKGDNGDKGDRHPSEMRSNQH